MGRVGHDRWVAARLYLICLAAAAPACTGGVVPGDAYEQPQEFEARLIAPLPSGSNPMVSVIWTDPLQRHPDVAMPVRWIDSTVAAPGPADPGGRLPFVFQIFRSPPPEALVEIEAPSGEVALVAVGELVIVDDADDDGTFAIDSQGTIPGADNTDGDQYLAGTATVLFYVARPFSSAIAATLGPFDKLGYQLVAYNCLGRLLVDHRVTSVAVFENQVSRVLVERRTCLRTHSP